EARDFGVDAGSAGAGVGLAFEDERARPFARDEAVALEVEGAAGLGRVAFPGGEGAHDAEASEPELANAGLAAAGEDDLGAPRTDHHRGLADRLRCGRAGGHDRAVVAAKPELERPLGAGHVAEALRHVERVELHAALLVDGLDSLLDVRVA